MKYLKFLISVSVLSFSLQMFGASGASSSGSSPCPDISSSDISFSPPSPHKYLYKPLVFKNIGATGLKCSSDKTVTFEEMFYVALVNTISKDLDGDGCNLGSISSCKYTNHLYKKIISETQVSGWNYKVENSQSTKQNKFYPKITMLSDLDYNAMTLGSKATVASWNAIQPNTWSIMPEMTSEAAAFGPSQLSFPCGYSASGNKFYIDLPAGSPNRPANRAQELSYFCYPFTSTNHPIGTAENASQSYINKSYFTTEKIVSIGSFMRPMVVFSSVTTYLNPINAPSSVPNSANSCGATLSYSGGAYWGFPFRGQDCAETKLENLYFMITEEVN